MLALQLALQDDLICGQFLAFYSHCASPIHATVRAPQRYIRRYHHH